MAEKLGFSMLGIVPALPGPHLDAYLRWIDAGLHGTMDYLAREDRLARRKDITVVLPGARSIVLAALDYYSLRLPDHIALDPTRGRISNYAWGKDYHDIMQPRLDDLAHFLRDELGFDTTTRVFVDTGAILERDHAQLGGLGFTGKNTMLIHPRRGSYFFLGEIITTAELDYDSPPKLKMPTCGTCTRCLAACPTSAFPAPYVLDARRCISYLTIEHKGFIPGELRLLMGNWVFGCDVCQEVCPWQRFAEPAWEQAFAPIDYDWAVPRLTSLLTLTDESFAEKYRGSPLYRIKRDRLVRNACIAAGNSGLVSFSDYLSPLLQDTSPLVRGHAVWALGRLKTGYVDLEEALNSETDEQVREEIHLALHPVSRE